MKINKKGFTLIELLVVVLIIGILAAIALPQYRKSIAMAKYATLKDKARTIYEAEQRYYLVNGTYSNDFNKLDVTVKGCAISGWDCNFYYVACGCSINGIPTTYIKWFYNGSATCLTFEVEDLNHISHWLCKTETGNTTPYCGEANCQYNY